MAAFVDRVTVHVAAGNGGHGVSSVHREKFKPLGGPDGGNGGDGGDIVLEVDPSVHTLLDFHHRPHQKAGNGQPGEGSNRHGARGEEKVLHVPAGTVVSTPDGRVIADLVGAGTRVVLAKGGKGGLGNAALANSRRKAPGFALLGEEGEAFDAVIELKSIADVGLVGLPVGGQVLADRRDVRGPPEDRRLPVHHAGAQPRRDPLRRHRPTRWPTSPA